MCRQCVHTWSYLWLVSRSTQTPPNTNSTIFPTEGQSSPTYTTQPHPHTTHTHTTHHTPLLTHPHTYTVHSCHALMPPHHITHTLTPSHRMMTSRLRVFSIVRTSWTRVVVEQLLAHGSSTTLSSLDLCSTSTETRETSSPTCQPAPPSM